MCLVTLVARRPRRRRPAPQHARLGDARRAGQRALGRGRRRQRRAGEGAELRPRRRSSPGSGGSLLAYRRGVVTFDSFTAIGGLALLSTAYLAGITSVWGGINAGILASTGIMFIALDRWVDLGAWFEVISGVLLIVTLITNPEGVAAAGHEIADRWRPLAAGAGARGRGRAPGRRRGRAPRRTPRSRRAGRRHAPVAPPPTGGSVARRSSTSRCATAAWSRSTTCRCRSSRRPDRRADRPERRGQDQRHRRGHGLRRARRGRSSWAGGASTAWPRTPACGPAWPARSSRSSSTTTSPSRRTSAWPPSGRRQAAPPAPPSTRALDERRHRGAARSPGGRAQPGRAPARVDRPGLRRRPRGAAARRARGRARQRRERVAGRAHPRHPARRAPACCSSTTTSTWC